jgi:tetratricopeptide (TPR) repeat protein
MRFVSVATVSILCVHLMQPAHAQGTSAVEPKSSASDVATCQKSEDLDARIAACSRSIEKTKDEKNRALAYANRGVARMLKSELDAALKDANRSVQIEPTIFGHHVRGTVYQRQGATDRAIKDFTRAIELKPDMAVSYSGRCLSYQFKDEQERALEDCNRAVQLAPTDSTGYNNRGFFYAGRKEYDKALADYNLAVELSPKNSVAVGNRGRLYVDMGQVESGLTDLNRAIALNPRNAYAYGARGLAYANKRDDQKALSDFETALKLDGKQVDVYFGRAEISLRSKKLELAIADLRQVLKLPARKLREREAQVRAAEMLTSLTSSTASTKPSVQTTIPAPAGQALPAPAFQGARRVALIIGNSRYATVGELRNPANDGHVIADAFRRIGFSEVMERFDLGLAGMTAALKEFGDLAANADWAVMEMGGAAYLVPVDAKLEKDAHVPDETISLDRMLQKTETAKKLRLVVLDACRNNPFVTRMARTGGATRSIGRGLPALEVEGDVLVAYATKHGTTALDGEGANSPYAIALAANLPVPDVDIRVMFGRVRDAVRKATNNQQEPYTYGSVGGELLFFATAARP